MFVLGRQSDRSQRDLIEPGSDLAACAKAALNGGGWGLGSITRVRLSSSGFLMKILGFRQEAATLGELQ